MIFMQELFFFVILTMKQKLMGIDVVGIDFSAKIIEMAKKMNGY